MYQLRTMCAPLPDGYKKRSETKNVSSAVHVKMSVNLTLSTGSTVKKSEFDMKKKLLTCILCLLITASAMFAGCSSPSSGNAQDSPDLAADQTSSAGSQDGNRSEDAPAQGDSSSGDAGESETEEVPVEAPDFEVTLVSGETVKLSDYRGQKVLLNFWATWCGPCVKEMPAFQRLYEEYPDDVVILAVNCGDTSGRGAGILLRKTAIPLILP